MFPIEEVGTMTDIGTIAKRVREVGALLAVDAVQMAAGSVQDCPLQYRRRNRPPHHSHSNLYTHANVLKTL
ncbi:hypothetical protein [Neobacillus muris]|uniref:hypothetical protein n=1 Tax=Neobacillus muris TaxID=2941334 RepID=UPI00203F0789|nr:hypothetical protein [Neobacillus muris]